MRRRDRAVLLLQPTVETGRQERVAYPWAEEHQLKVVSVTSDPWSALRLIAGNAVQVVLVTFATDETENFASMVDSAGGRLEAVLKGRRTQRASRGAAGALRADVEAALHRGATPEQIAIVLGLTVEQVEAATPQARASGARSASTAARTPRHRRTERVAR